MKKEGLLIAVLAIVILAAGCSSGGNTSKTSNPNSGTSGLEISFYHLPSVVYDASKIDVLIEARNKGAFASKGAIYFSGFDDKIFTLGSMSNKMNNLEGKSTYNPEGGMEIIDVSEGQGGALVKLPENMNSLTLPIQATVCYYYETNSFFELCVDPSPTSIGIKACTATASISGGNGQGGPVSITNIQQDSSSSNAIFRISLKNAGGGQIIDDTSVDTCRIPTISQMNTITDYSVTLGGNDGASLTCKPDDKILFYQDTASMICTINLVGGPGTGKDAYRTVIQVHLGYNYRKSIAQNIELRRI